MVPDAFLIMLGVAAIISAPFIGIGIMVTMIKRASARANVPKQFEDQIRALRSEIEALRSTTTTHSMSLQQQMDNIDDRMRHFENRLQQAENKPLEQRNY
jgi:TolA-binding protein